jgi:hypothetical protein
MKQLNLFVSLLLISVSLCSQERVVVYGKINSGTLTVENIHVLNMSTYKGDVTNANGEFSIEAELNDILVITSVEYDLKKIVVDAVILESRKLEVTLKSSVNELDVVTIKQHNLSGNLYTDTEKVPESFEKYKRYDLKVTKFDLQPRVENFTDDDLMRPPDASSLTDVGALPGAQMNFALLLKPLTKIFKNKKKQKRKQLKEERSKSIKNIRTFYGDNFFVKQLKIKEAKIEEFLEYCEYKNVFALFLNNKKLEFVEVLLSESKKFLNEK